jgi:hypothetical protein
MLTSPSTPHEDERQHTDSCSTSRRYLGTVYDRRTHFKIIQKPLSHVSSSIPLPPPLPSDISCGILRSYICFTVSSIPNLTNSSSSTLTRSARASALRYRSYDFPIPTKPCECCDVDLSISSATTITRQSVLYLRIWSVEWTTHIPSSASHPATASNPHPPNITRSISPLRAIHHMRTSSGRGLSRCFL